MKKAAIITILFTLMTTYANAQWTTSNFFTSAPKSEYKVSLQGRLSTLYALSEEDAKELIDILSSCKWEQKKGEHESSIEVYQAGWGRYHYYMHHYYISVTHPNKRAVRLRINSGGIGKDEFVIEQANGKTYGILREKEEYGNRLSTENIKRIKQLFFNNVVDFGNISLAPNDTIKISSIFSFPLAFGSFISLPPISFNEEDSKEFVRLINSGWSNFAMSFEGGQPLPVFHLYEHFKTALLVEAVVGTSYDFSDMCSISYPFSDFEFKDGDREALLQLVDNALSELHGEREEVLERYNQKICYQYRNGLLDGKVEVYTLDGKLTSRLVYDEGFPTSYIKYSDEGLKVKKCHLSKDAGLVSWIEYGENEEIKDSGESRYKTLFHGWEDMGNFYKGEKSISQ